MSRMMTAPIVGAIAGNALKSLRVEIDYANAVAYVEQTQQPVANSLDAVGIIFQVADDSSYRISGVAPKGDRAVVEGVRAGDQLLSVDGPVVTGASRDIVIRALQGKPGDKRKLRLLREGKEFELEVTVQHLL